MEEAKKKSLRELYDLHYEASRKAYKEWTDPSFDDSEEAVFDREVLNRICSRISKQALLGSPAEWNRVPALSQEVIRAHESLINKPNTRLPGIWKSLVQIADKVTKLEMEKKERQSTGKANKGEASTGNPAEKKLYLLWFH